MTHLRKKQTNLFLAFFLLIPLSLLAHHGEAPHYDASKELVVEGLLTDFQLVNPHSYVYFDVRGDDGEAQNWRCELGTNLRRFGWTEETLAPGGRVRVTGNPARREEHVCKINSIEHEDGRTIGFRGTPTEGTSTYKPDADQLSFNPQEKPKLDVLATGSNAAKERTIVDVPTEGFFGYWQANSAGVIGIAGVGRNRGDDADQLQSDLPMPTTFLVPDYTEAGQSLLDKYDDRYDSPNLYCKSSIFDGMVHHTITNEFVQVDENTIRWVYGFMDLVRTIHLDQDTHPIEPALNSTGHSIGHWEGDTLVVETAGFQKQWLYSASRTNVLASEELVVTERLTFDEANDQLVIEYTAEDPVYWNAPISGVMRLGRSDEAYQLYDCVELAGDNNRRADGSTIFDSPLAMIDTSTTTQVISNENIEPTTSSSIESSDNDEEPGFFDRLIEFFKN